MVQLNNKHVEHWKQLIETILGLCDTHLFPFTACTFTLQGSVLTDKSVDNANHLVN